MLVCLSLLLATEASIGQNDDAPAETATPAVQAPAGPGAVAGPGKLDNLAVITIFGEINAVTSKSFERRFNEAIDAGADGVVVEINTPGGAVGAVQEITKILKQSPVPTVAWINTDAYSGGAIIAIACDEIVIAKGTMFGDAAPIAFGMMGLVNLGETERAKILAVLIAEVVDSAALNGYDEVLTTGMIMLNVETWLVEHKDTGARYFLTENEYRALFDQEPERATPLVQSGGVDPASLAPLPQIPDRAVATDAEGTPIEAPPQTLPEDASPALRALTGVVDESTVAAASNSITNRSTRPDFAAEDPDDYRFIQYATDGQTLLTLNETGMRGLGFTRYPKTIDTDEELKQYVAAQTLVRLDQSWSEDLVEFTTMGITGMVFQGLCVAIFLLCLFIEISMPGVGIAGLIALIALAGLVLPKMLIDASGWWTLVAILLGIALIVVEIMIIPGFGIPGITGLLLLVVGLVGAFSNPGELFPGSGAGQDSRLGWSIATVFLAIFGACVGMYFFTKYTRSIPIARSLILSDTLATYDTGARVGMLAAMDGAPDVALSPGDEGLTMTVLRPEGEAEFNGEMFDVSCHDGWVDRNQRIRVVEVVGNRVVVVPIERAEDRA